MSGSADRHIVAVNSGQRGLVHARGVILKYKGIFQFFA